MTLISSIRTIVLRAKSNSNVTRRSCHSRNSRTATYEFATISAHCWNSRFERAKLASQK